MLIHGIIWLYSLLHDLNPPTALNDCCHVFRKLECQHSVARPSYLNCEALKQGGEGIFGVAHGVGNRLSRLHQHFELIKIGF
jgi:hypothetical protein